MKSVNLITILVLSATAAFLVTLFISWDPMFAMSSFLLVIIGPLNVYTLITEITHKKWKYGKKDTILFMCMFLVILILIIFMFLYSLIRFLNGI
ncbi:MAG: hypothetical protein ACFFHV_21755 [Promethearchaeota archaeon]